MDLALTVALGGDCLADIALLRSEQALFGPVASDPTVSRLIDPLAASGEKALTAIRAARSQVRKDVWDLAGNQAPGADGQVTVDLDGVLVTAHSDKQDAAPTWKKTYGLRAQTRSSVVVMRIRHQHDHRSRACIHIWPRTNAT